jgi:hypothetical protein
VRRRRKRLNDGSIVWANAASNQVHMVTLTLEARWNRRRRPLPPVAAEARVSFHLSRKRHPTRALLPGKPGLEQASEPKGTSSAAQELASSVSSKSGRFTTSSFRFAISPYDALTSATSKTTCATKPVCGDRCSSVWRSPVRRSSASCWARLPQLRPINSPPASTSVRPASSTDLAPQQAASRTKRT